MMDVMEADNDMDQEEGGQPDDNVELEPPAEEFHVPGRYRLI